MEIKDFKVFMEKHNKIIELANNLGYVVSIFKEDKPFCKKDYKIILHKKEEEILEI